MEQLISQSIMEGVMIKQIAERKRKSKTTADAKLQMSHSRICFVREHGVWSSVFQFDDDKQYGKANCVLGKTNLRIVQNGLLHYRADLQLTLGEHDELMMLTL